MTISPELLLEAYRSGIFPMAERRDDPDIFWVDPRRRGILPLDGFHISRSLARKLRRDPFRISLNEAFDGVIDGCAQRAETWINAEIRSLYRTLHARGDAHSLETWDGEELVGGVYGLAIGGVFCGESMFSTRTDASKVALAFLTSHLRGCGFRLFDTQFLTAHLKSLGGKEISRSAYRSRLAEALELDADIHARALPASGQDVLQRNTQTS